MADKAIAWATDIHLNFVGEAGFRKFIDELLLKSPETLLIAGDISDGPGVMPCLRKLEASVKSKICFVLGNHDSYHGSISKTRSLAEQLSKEFERLVFLDGHAPVEMAEGVALVGHSGWADGRYGDYGRSDVMLNDYVLIDDFKGLSKMQRLDKLNELGDEAAGHLRRSLSDALQEYEKVICLTHVPPFQEACLYEGRRTDENHLPHFANKAAGDAMLDVMEGRPNARLSVLCGHTHSHSHVKIRENLVVTAGGAQYGQPKLQDDAALLEFLR
ncbi:MAG: metallophosphoesterase [Methanobacteriota archaeon]